MATLMKEESEQMAKFLSKLGIWEVSWIFIFLVDLLGEHYAEECHKQWLPLGLISELVSQVQKFKDYTSRPCT